MTRKSALYLIAVFALLFFLSSCAPKPGTQPAGEQQDATEKDRTRYITAVEDEPDTVDFQCTTIHYTIAQNVFNRLVETENDDRGEMQILPSLAESWEVSEDGRCYTFRLRNGVSFSNGSPLTSKDVEYTFKRLLTHPESCNRDIADDIVGADALASGETDELEGFRVIDDNELPRLRVAAAGRQASRFHKFHQVLS